MIPPILSVLFIIFGSYAIYRPEGVLVDEIRKSYSVADLIRGWGIYSVTIGLLLYCHDRYHSYILYICFMSSIIWHLVISHSKGWTRHHRQSIIYNVIAIILLVILG